MLKVVISASHIKHYVCIMNIIQFLHFREIVALHSESHALHIYIYIYIYCGQNAEILYSEEGSV